MQFILCDALAKCHRKKFAQDFPPAIISYNTQHPYPSSGTACATVRHSLGVDMTSISSGGNSIRSLRGPDSTMGGWVFRYSSKSTGSTASVRGTWWRERRGKRSQKCGKKLNVLQRHSELCLQLFLCMLNLKWSGNVAWLKIHILK